MNKSQIRREIRQRRNALTKQQQRFAAESLSQQLANLPEFKRAKRVALYLGNDGEIDPLPTLALAEAAGKTCYLPVLHPLKHNRIHFVRYRTGERLTTSYFGYPEPLLKHHQITQPWAIDLILMPLVAFDESGNRLGMGGGFYDRTLAFTTRTPSRPRLIGLAHQCQQIDQIDVEPWDIPLDAIVTDKSVIRCR